MDILERMRFVDALFDVTGYPLLPPNEVLESLGGLAMGRVPSGSITCDPGHHRMWFCCSCRCAGMPLTIPGDGCSLLVSVVV